MAISLNLNGKTHSVHDEPGTPVLWVIRDELKLTGTKFGCGVAITERAFTNYIEFNH